jgi:hypothetical protein
LKKVTKKLYLTRETLVRLQNVNGAMAAAPATLPDENTVASGGPAICYISDCNPCPGTVYSGDAVALKAN